MQQDTDTSMRKKLLTLYCQETDERLQRVLQELQRGSRECDYDAVHQEFDSMRGGARVADLGWQENTSRVLAAYARFLKNLGSGATDTGHSLLLETVHTLQRECTRLSVDDLLQGRSVGQRFPELLRGLERNMAEAVEKRCCRGPVHTILIVDDSATSRMLFRIHLPNAERYRVIEADGLQAAMQQARTERPDLVFMDFNMPQADGVEIARRMREEGLAECFVLMTANVQQTVLEAAREAGFAGLLEKPVDAARIARLMAELNA